MASPRELPREKAPGAEMIHGVGSERERPAEHDRVAHPRFALVTGANTGIGHAAAHAPALRGFTVIVASRDGTRNDAAAVAIRHATGSDQIHTIPLDLASFTSIRNAAAAFLDLRLPLHALLNNAGLAGQPGVTKDGFERTFGVNHLGHYLLTHLLLDHLRASAPARIIHVASAAHLRARPLVALAADHTTHGNSGDYFADGRPARRHPLADDAAATRELWDRSAAWTGMG